MRERPKDTAPAGETLSAKAEEDAVAAPDASNAQPAAERRLSPRFSCDIGITMNWGGAVLDGRVVDISAHGMFVKIDKPLWIGAEFTAQLVVEKPVRIECVVRRIEPFRGMALTYLVPHETEQAALAAIFEKLRPA